MHTGGQPSSMIDDGLVPVSYAVRFLHLSRSKIYQLMDKGELAYARFGRARRIAKRALRDYAAKQLVG